MKRRTLKRILIGLFVLWALTLGIHVERRITIWPSDHESEHTWDAFEAGTTPKHINLSIYPTNDRQIGIPFLATYITDRPPCSATFIITVPKEIGLTNVELTRFFILEGANSPSLSIPTSALAQPYIYDDDMFGMKVTRAEIRLPDYKAFDFPIQIEIEGNIISESDSIPFQETLTQRANWNLDIVPGWMIALLKWSGI